MKTVDMSMRLISRATLWAAEAADVFKPLSNRVISFIQSFVAVILTPGEIDAYTKQFYDQDPSPYADRAWIDSGLTNSEKDVILKYAGQRGSVLVIGCGGGREAIALVRMGFHVIGIDSSEKMVRKAKGYAAREYEKIEILKGDFLEMTLPEANYDYCLLSCFMYSLIPTRARRVAFLKKIRAISGGRGIAILHFISQFGGGQERLFQLRKAVARVFKGNMSYQRGDVFYPPWHFFHKFLDEQEIIGEAREAGFIVKEIMKDTYYYKGAYAVLQKSLRQ